MNRTARRLAGAVSGLAAAGMAALGLAGPAGAAAGGSHGVVHVVHVAGGKAATNQSNNWSGYNIGAQYPGEPTGVTFTSISGQWTVPAATQHKPGQAEFSASWLGIGPTITTRGAARPNP